MYVINGYKYNDEDAFEFLVDLMDTGEFDKYLNDNFPVEIDGVKFDASYVLYKMNKMKYYDHFTEWSKEFARTLLDKAKEPNTSEVTYNKLKISYIGR